MSDLQLALDLWRRTRHEPLESVIAGLTPAAAERGPPLEGSPDDRHAAWLDVARRDDPADVAWLLDGVVESRVEPSAIRLEHLCSLGPHPLVGQAARDWIRKGVFRTQLEHRWWSLLRDAAAWGPVDFPQLAGELGRDPTTSMRRVAKLVASWSNPLRSGTAPTPSDALRIEDLRRRQPPPRPRPRPDTLLADLYHAVHADLDADAPREVLADYLVSLGDLRGRFLRLQLDRHARGGPDAFELKQLPPAERALVEAHGPDWFGPHFLTVMGGAPERGFFAQARPKAHFDRLDTVLDEPAARTLRHLRLPRRLILSRRVLERLLAAESLAALERLDHLWPRDLPLLGDIPARPRWLGVEALATLAGVGDAVDRLSGLERLDLTVHPDHAAAIGTIAVPTLGVQAEHWLAVEPNYTATRIRPEDQARRLAMLLHSVHSDVRRLVVFGAEEGVALARRGASWGLDLRSLFGRWRGPAEPVYVSLSLVRSLGITDVAVDSDDADVAYRLDVTTNVRHLQDLLEVLPPRPLLIDAGQGGPQLSWLGVLPALPEIRIVAPSSRVLSVVDRSPRFDRARIVGVDLAPGPILWRGDDGRLRYAWAPGGIPDEERARLEWLLGRRLELAPPP